MSFGSKTERELQEKLKLAEARALMTTVYTGKGVFLHRKYDPENTKMQVPAEVVRDSKMRDREKYHCCYPRTQEQLDATVMVMRDLFARGAPVIVYLFSGVEEGAE